MILKQEKGSSSNVIGSMCSQKRQQQHCKSFSEQEQEQFKGEGHSKRFARSIFHWLNEMDTNVKITVNNGFRQNEI